MKINFVQILNICILSIFLLCSSCSTEKKINITKNITTEQFKTTAEKYGFEIAEDKTEGIDEKYKRIILATLNVRDNNPGCKIAFIITKDKISAENIYSKTKNEVILKVKKDIKNKSNLYLKKEEKIFANGKKYRLKIEPNNMFFYIYCIDDIILTVNLTESIYENKVEKMLDELNILNI